MSKTNLAIGQQVNLAEVLNKKLEGPVLQSDMGLDVAANATGQAVRWDEFSIGHNNDGTPKDVDQSNMNLTTAASAPGQPIRWDEFSLKHNNDGTFKGIDQMDMKLSALATLAGQPIRFEEFTLKHNNDGSFKGIDQADIKLSAAASATTQAVRWDEFSLKHNNDGSFKGITDADINATAAIKASKLAIQLNYKKSVTANPSATADTDGTVATLAPAAGYVSLFPRAIDIVFGGTFGTETVTTTVKVTYSDATTATVTKQATAVGTTSFSNSDLMALIKDATFIKQIDLSSKSNIASSTATVTINHCGLYL